MRCELVHDKSNVHLSMVQLPGVNTTQFDWVKNLLPNKPKPMGRIYQPEVAAEAIHWAAHHRRRELYVGMPAFDSIAVNKIAPSVLDRYLGHTGYSGQQTREPKDPRRLDNLWQSVPGDHGAHGRFDSQATRTSPELWLAKNKYRLGITAAVCGALVGGFFLFRKATG